MGNDLEELRAGAAYIVRKMMNKTKNPIHNYIFSPFNDPKVGPLLVTTDPQELLNTLDQVKVESINNWECPEMSLTGIIEGLQECLPNSFVYVFTDADAKDFTLISDVLTLIQEKRTSITFIVADDSCQRNPKFETYYQIADASNGQVYRIKSTDTNTILESVGETLDEKIQILKVINSDKAGLHKIPLEVDKHLTDFTISVSGSDPNITVHNPENEPSAKAKKLVDLSNVKTVKVDDPEPGLWNIDASSTSKHSVKIAGASDLQFIYGFTLHTPLTIQEVQHRPTRDQDNIFSIQPSDPDSIRNLKTVRFFRNDPKDSFELTLPLIAPENSYLFTCEPFRPPAGFVKIEIKGEDSDGNPFTRILPTGLDTADVGKPQYLGKSLEQSIELSPNTSVELDCKMVGKPDPNIRWFKNGNEILGANGEVLQIEYEHDKPIKYKCEGTNTEGSESVTFKVNNAELPEVVHSLMLFQNASTITVLVGDPVSLGCPVKGIPGPTLKWSRNSEFLSENNEFLNISKSGTSDSGVYECLAENRAGSIILKYTLDVDEPPNFSTKTDGETSEEKLSGKSKNPLTLECPIIGKPQPEITWYHEDSTNVPKRKLIKNISDTKLTILVSDQVQKYVCIRTNKHGSLEKVFLVNPLIPPELIEPTVRDIKVKPEKSFTLDCSVHTLDPETTIKWFKNGQPLTLDGKKFVSYDNFKLIVTHTNAEADSGEYLCLVENQGGTVEKKFTARPYVSTRWSSWTYWTYCNCRAHTQMRIRYCIYYNGSMVAPEDKFQCSGDSIQIQPCDC
ncbi:Immunoglobulin [Sergentomyia squamirostris]